MAQTDKPRQSLRRGKSPVVTSRIAVDRGSVAIEFLHGSGAQGYMRFTRDDLTGFIRFLGNIRSYMPDPKPPKRLTGRNVPTIVDPRWGFHLNGNRTGSVLMFDHPAFGIIRFIVPRNEVESIHTLLGRHLEAMQKPKT
jgi:hypothetical protein